MKFIIFYHYKIEEPHYDLMIESEDLLDSWRIPEMNLESLLNGEVIEITSIHSHNKKYLDYEGELSSEKGSVEIYDKGATTYTNFDSPEFEVLIFGSILTGRLLFSKIEDNRFNLIFIRLLEGIPANENIS
jgi:hypothetical protein